MKRLIVLAFLMAIVGTAAFGQSGGLTVAIDQTTGDAWQAVVDSFQASTGVPVSLRSYSQNSLPTQVVVQSYRASSQFHLAMIPESWATTLAGYVVDLSDVEAELRSRGVSPVVAGRRVIGVPIPFADGWVLAVVEWPAEERAAIEFLVATASGTAATAEPSKVTPQGIATGYATAKISITEHNPVLDGSIEALLGAAKDTLTAVATQVMSALPAAARNALEGLATMYGVPFSASTSSVTVVLESSPGRSASNVSALSRLGVSRSDIETTSSLIKVTVPLSQLSDIVAQLPGVSFIRPPYVPYPLATSTQGVAAIGATAFHSAGLTGSGTKIAVIDLGYSGLTQAQARGDLPYTVHQHDLTGTGLTTGITHGTAVAEVIHDIAPGAELHLIKIADEVDLDLAVTYCINNGIDIINHSLGWYNTNFYDGTGTVADTARRAVSAGILWVNAAGNEAESHWEGTFVDGNSDGVLDQTISFYASAGSPIVVFMTWNDWPQASSDYDLYLHDPTSALVASSTKHQTGTEEPTESVQVTASMSGTYTLRIHGAGSKKLELFSLYQPVSPVVAASSILAPGNVAEVVTVGAIDHANYITGPQQPHSSQGPTNDGRTKPDLAAPDNVATGTSPYTTFPGTSAAAPHAAAAAALLLSQNPSLGETALRAHLLAQTIPMGSPNIYGNGRLYLDPPVAANVPPTAQFSVSPTSGPAGTSFTFNGSASYDSDGTITSYAWQYGDGSTDTGSVVSHVYTVAGTYTVRLTVTDDDGATDTETRTLTVSATSNQPPTAAFSFSPTSAAPGDWFQFNGSASSDADGTIVGYAWQFGDGSTDSGPVAYHAYTSTGTYTVRLTVTDDDGATDVETHTVVVTSGANQLPTAAFSVSPTSGPPGTQFTFNATASTDPDGSIVSYAWQFGDGTTGSGVATQHTYASAGTYTVQLTVTDNQGASDSETKTVSVQLAAAPDLTVQSVTYAPSSPTIGQTVTFTITARNAGTASAGFFRVLLEGAASSTQTYVLSLAAGASRTFTLSLPLTASPETFTVTLDDLDQIAESNESNNGHATTVSAAAVPVVADADGPYSATAGVPITLDGTGSSGPITAYAWSFGDGATGSGVTPSHAYSAPGTYTATLTVYGSGGLQSTDTATVSISPAAPSMAAQLSLPKTVYEVDESLVITYTVNRTAYVYLCQVTADGRVVLLFPSWIEPTLPVSAGTHTVPGGAYSLRITEPIGTDTLYLFAATSPVSTFPTSFGYGFPVLSTNPSSFRNSVLSTMQSQLPSGDWAFDSLTFDIVSAAPTTGVLRVESSPSGASVTVDGSPFGTTPRQQDMAPGTYTVQFTLSGYDPETRIATVTAGQQTTVHATLSPSAPTTGVLRVESTPSGASVTVNGSPFGTTPRQQSASPGTYTVQFTLPGYDPETRIATVTAGQQTTVYVTLTPTAPTTGVLRVESTPSGASVKIDGVSVGTSPVERSGLAPGSHSVEVSKTGYYTETTVASVSVGTTTLVQLTLTPMPVNDPPVASFTHTPTNPYAGQTVQFDGSTSHDPDGSIVSYAWNFGDGGTATGAVVSHAFASPSTYSVKLTVTDNDGGTDTETKSISIQSLEDLGWVNPVTYEDPADNWDVERRAIDDDTGNYATQRVHGGTWTSYVIYKTDTEDIGFVSDGVRFRAGDAFPYNNMLEWEVDVYRNGEWVNVFDDAIDEFKWMEVAFTAGNVTRVRLRAYNTAGGTTSADLYGIQLHDPSITPP